MAFLQKFYKEVEMENVVHNFPNSLVAFTSSSPFSIPLGEDGSGWTGSYGSDDFQTYLTAQVGANTQGITVSGEPLFDMGNSALRPYNATSSPNNYWLSDKKTEDGALIYMAGFTSNLGVRNQQQTGFAFRFSYENNYYGSTDRYGFTIERLYYTQSPQEGERTAWKYWGVADGSTFAKEYTLPIYKTDVNAGKGNIFLSSTVIGEKEYIVFICGVDASGQVNANTYMYALPKSISMPSEGEPYVGPVSAESVETSFVPTEEIHDDISFTSVAPNELYNVNNNPDGMGIRLQIPTFGQLSRIFAAIYRGTSQGIFNLITQTWAELMGGNANRSADEIQAILNAILCCHSLPVIVPEGTYVASPSPHVGMTTIAGYYLGLSDFGLTPTDIQNPGYKSIFQSSYTVHSVTPRLNCFLDYEPYTKMTLKIPFFSPISVPPSLIYNNMLTFHFSIDLISGLLACDIKCHGTILTTMTTNVKTDIPLMGSGSNGAGLQKITTAIAGGLISGGVSDAAVIGQGLTLADELSKANTGIVVGKEGSSNLAPYFAPRSVYLIITHPKAAIPAAKEDGKIKGTFLDQVGMAANLGYKISECAGGWNKFSSVDLSQVQAPQAVKEDILARLREGVYIE